MSGPYLYDEEPESLHTGVPRNRNWSIVAVLVLTALLAIGTVVGMYVFRGSPADEAQEVAGVFVAALAADDVETASGLLCEEQRRGVTGDAALEPYRQGGTGTPGTARETEVDGGPAVVVPVRWSDGTTTELVLVPEGGPRVCGVR